MYVDINKYWKLFYKN